MVGGQGIRPPRQISTEQLRQLAVGRREPLLQPPADGRADARGHRPWPRRRTEVVRLPGRQTDEGLDTVERAVRVPQQVVVQDDEQPVADRVLPAAHLLRVQAATGVRVQAVMATAGVVGQPLVLRGQRALEVELLVTVRPVVEVMGESAGRRLAEHGDEPRGRQRSGRARRRVRVEQVVGRCLACSGLRVVEHREVAPVPPARGASATSGTGSPSGPGDRRRGVARGVGTTRWSRPAALR